MALAACMFVYTRAKTMSIYQNAARVASLQTKSLCKQRLILQQIPTIILLIKKFWRAFKNIFLVVLTQST